MKPQASIDTALKIYDNNKQMFIDVLMPRDAMTEICPIARMSAWDIYHVWSACVKIPNDGNYLEIGSAEGGSIIMADYARNVSNWFDITAISLLDKTTRGQTFSNTKSIGFRFIEKKSNQGGPLIEDNSMDVIFLDCDKRYEPMKSDLAMYWPKLKKGGTLFCHDFRWNPIYGDEGWGILRAVTEFFIVEEITRLYKSSLCRIVK